MIFKNVLCSVTFFKLISTLILVVIHAESVYCDVSPKKMMYSSKNILRLEVREVTFLFYRFLGVNNVIST